ncbi:MAG: substrate-binding domain-containing protein [Frankiaceae bacterium]|nr:substrate-binding domain-containing protein [Frankiaceae bacterium]
MGTGSRLRVLVSCALMISVGFGPAVAHADDSGTVTVVGTSDVVDSNLVAAVLQPGFEAAYPQYKLKYVSQGTGPAIATAESGAASALLVHAASLENQFVAAGYSAEQYGRATFYGDYVLLGPQSDPAGVLSGARHDVAAAFERIAAAGAAGHANFVSRGGTPGTTVEEHAIWALTQGVTTCDVDPANGGGTSPSTDAGPCPSSISFPSWYHVTGLSQGPNVENADVCNYDNGNCYVLTDRGTFDYLVATGAVSQLTIVTRDNAAKSRGGSSLLVNSFHLYAVNPAKFTGQPNVHINLTGAEAFLDWVTSPAGQDAVGAFMAGSGDPPFRPDAAPLVAAHHRHTVRAGRALVVHGAVSNRVPGTPPLAGIEVDLMGARKGHKPHVVAATTTHSRGTYTVRYRPHRTLRYRIATPAVQQVEIPCRHRNPKNRPSLCPKFGDELAATTVRLGKVPVRGRVTLAQPTERGGKVLLAGALRPAVTGKRARLVVQAKTSGHRFHRVGVRPLDPGARRFAVKVALRPGRAWTVRVTYTNPGLIVRTTSRHRTLVV